MDGFDSVVYNIMGENGLLGLDFYKFAFMDKMKEITNGEKNHVDRVDGKYPVWYSLVTDEYSSAELLQYYFDNCTFIEEDPLTPEECDFLLREMYSDYEIPDEKLRILIDHGMKSSGKKTEYGEPDSGYSEPEYALLFNCDCTDKNAPNALYYAIVGKYPVSTLKLLHEEAKVPYDVDCKGVPFLVHAMDASCSEEVFRYLVEIAPADFDTYVDRFGNNLQYYIEKYEYEYIWDKMNEEWQSDLEASMWEDYDLGFKPYLGDYNGSDKQK